MEVNRQILKIYRKYQYKICHREEKGTMRPGVLCNHTPFEEDDNHGDVVHPCVRYIPEGYEGHCWWMVYTPYYKSDSKSENPILCYSESNEPVPPTHWKVYCKVQERPSKGYNSDPVLFYTNNTLYVFWRENDTQRCNQNGFIRATFGGAVKDGKIDNIFGPVVGTTDLERDPETSPAIIQEPNGTFRCLAMDLTFHSKIINSLHNPFKRIVSKFVLFLDLLGIWSQQKSHGIAQWSCSTFDGKYRLDQTVKFKNKNALYRPWHIDFFEWENILYAVVQTNQCNGDICLAVSNDRVHFHFLDKPLMTNATCGKLGIYKPTAGVVNGIFYLYYTAQDVDNRSLNKLYLTSCKFTEILK